VFKLELPFTQISWLAAILKRISGVALFAILIGSTLSTADSGKSSVAQRSNEVRDNSSPWGVASGAEWFSAYPVFNPMLKRAGVQWLRGFYEWQTIQPKQGYWNFALPDHLVENARANDIHLTGVFAYFAPWASADGGTRKFPIKDIQFWRDYIAGMVGRYHSDIKYWEVWNEFNGSFAENGTPEIYAELVREASIAAKTIDPTAKIGMSVANFDVGFLDAAIKAGAANYFDYICVHPYEKVASLLNDGEIAFLNMAATLRKMLMSNNQPSDIPLWITEIGSPAPVSRSDESDEAQAIVLAKAFLLSIASGFERVFWFEARGPSYGNQTDFGLLRSDMTPRPSYNALKPLTGVLGPQPAAAGWLNFDNGGYGFLFDVQEGNVMATWAPAKREIKITFAGEVLVHDLTGEQRSLAAGETLTVKGSPVLITNLPATLVQEARANKAKAYPWGAEHARAQTVTARLQTTNIENGIQQINPTTTVSNESWRRTDFSRADREGHYVYFSVDPQFTPFGTKDLEITAVVRRIAPDKVAGMSLNYESQRGYVNTAYLDIPESDEWHEVSWKVSDANFVGAWGWNFRINAISSPNEFLIKEVKVRKPG
jgi:polysaccharide biosynthesis protein PslG